MIELRAMSRVRRASWPPHWYLYLEPAKSEIVLHMQDGSAIMWRATNPQILAEDWETQPKENYNG